jgi:hypothetical protein
MVTRRRDPPLVQGYGRCRLAASVHTQLDQHTLRVVSGGVSADVQQMSEGGIGVTLLQQHDAGITQCGEAFLKARD